MLDLDVAQRFWNKVGKHDNDASCWLWLGATHGDRYGLSRYGHMRVGSYTMQAHRIAYTLLKGEIPEGLESDHLCRNTLCVNPEHMELVSHQINVLRSTAPTALNSKKTQCPAGHSYDAVNTRITTDGSRRCRACDRIAYQKGMHHA